MFCLARSAPSRQRKRLWKLEDRGDLGATDLKEAADRSEELAEAPAAIAPVVVGADQTAKGAIKHNADAQKNEISQTAAWLP